MSTRTQLAADITEWTSRDELGTAPTFDSLLRVAEANIKRKVRVREQEKRITLNMTAEATDLPNDFIRLRSFTLVAQADERSIDYYPPEAFRKSPVYINRSSFSSGLPQGFTIEGTQILVAPAPTADVPVEATLVYVAFYDSLAAGSDTNWLLQQAYDVYLYSTLEAAAIYGEDLEMGAVYRDKFMMAADDLNKSENRARFPKTGLRQIGSPHAIV